MERFALRASAAPRRPRLLSSIACRRTLVLALTLAASLPVVASADFIVMGPATVAPGAPGWFVPAGVTVLGTGTLAASSNPAAATLIDGVLQGLSTSAPIKLTGYAKGAGKFNNVQFAGVISPGMSPALITVGSVVYTTNNVLEMEIGGLNAGSQYDKIIHTGQATAGGTLKVVLINGFTPQAGNVFDIFDWNAGVVGSFSVFDLPTLGGGLGWDTSNVHTTGNLLVSIVPEASAALFIGAAAALALLGALWRRRRSRAPC